MAPNIDKSYQDNFPYPVLRVSSVKLPMAEYRLAMPYMSQDVTNYLTGGGFEIFHAHTPFAVGRYGMRMAKKLGIPIVATFHSKYYDDILRISKSELIASTVVDTIVDFYSKADSVWACSGGTASTLRDYGYKGEIFVADNGTDFSYPDDPDSVRRKAREKYSIPENKPVLLFVGHLIWQKNIKLVLDAARILLDSGFDFELVLAGKGYAEAEIKQYAEKLFPSEKNIRFIGQIEDREILKGLYLCSDIFFFPSVYDNSPLVLREAAAMGTPGLLVRGSNAAEKITDGVNGYICEENAEHAAEKIKAIFSSEKSPEEIGKAAMQTVSCPWSRIIPVVIDKYNSVIKNFNK